MALSEKEIYRALCRTEDGLPLFSRDWWLDAACGEDHWDALLIEDRGRIAAALPLYQPLLVRSPGRGHEVCLCVGAPPGAYDDAAGAT